MTDEPLRFCQFGAGRIGQIHAANLAVHPDAELVSVVDVVADAAEALAANQGARVTTPDDALADDTVDAVIIASSTDTHADLIEASARAGKAIFCEKPIDLDIKRVDACLAVVAECDVPLFVGFNRRFDPSFAALKARLDDGEIGPVEMVSITSRDPGPPSLAYLKVSGGLFRDMMIHDLDMARWLLSEEPVQVFAFVEALVDPAVATVGDVDTAVVVLRTASGRLAQISNSRRAVYGYDQRVEVLGGAGMLRAENQRPTSVEIATEASTRTDNPLHFFLERYADAYRIELDTFIGAVRGGHAPQPGGGDGRMALRLADALVQSRETGAPVDV